MQAQQCRFFSVYGPSMFHVIGEVKSDPFRQELKWTALARSGARIGDFGSRHEAEDAVRETFIGETE